MMNPLVSSTHQLLHCYFLARSTSFFQSNFNKKQVFATPKGSELCCVCMVFCCLVLLQIIHCTNLAMGRPCVKLTTWHRTISAPVLHTLHQPLLFYAAMLQTNRHLLLISVTERAYHGQNRIAQCIAAGLSTQNEPRALPTILLSFNPRVLWSLYMVHIDRNREFPLSAVYTATIAVTAPHEWEPVAVLRFSHLVTYFLEISVLRMFGTVCPSLRIRTRHAVSHWISQAGAEFFFGITSFYVLRTIRVSAPLGGISSTSVWFQLALLMCSLLCVTVALHKCI